MTVLIRSALVLGLSMFGFCLGAAAPARAQGQDSTPSERDIMVLAEMLPGVFDNQEQVYFDDRTKVRPEARHARMNLKIARVDLPAFGPYVFFAQESANNNLDAPVALKLYSLSVDNAAKAVRMRTYNLDAMSNGTTKHINAHQTPDALAGLAPDNTPFNAGCDILWRRAAAQFEGATEAKSCQHRGGGQRQIIEINMQLAQNTFWLREATFTRGGKQIAGNPDAIHHKLNRARDFSCQADIPGVGGGRAIPFKRYGPFAMTDQGGQVSFKSEEEPPRDVTILLRNVDWPINNETGAFTRDVLVTYVMEKKPDGSIAQSAYSFTEPTVKRTGLNLGWILVQCYTESNRAGKPEF